MVQGAGAQGNDRRGGAGQLTTGAARGRRELRRSDPFASGPLIAT
jgi:hypothetical protein